jgi:hypothetical protein
MSRNRFALSKGVHHLSIRPDLPGLDRVEVIIPVIAARLFQGRERGLRIAVFVRAARLQHYLTPVPFPGVAETCEGDRQHWRL